MCNAQQWCLSDLWRGIIIIHMRSSCTPCVMRHMCTLGAPYAATLLTCFWLARAPRTFGRKGNAMCAYIPAIFAIAITDIQQRGLTSFFGERLRLGYPQSLHRRDRLRLQAPGMRHQLYATFRRRNMESKRIDEDTGEDEHANDPGKGTGGHQINPKRRDEKANTRHEQTHCLGIGQERAMRRREKPRDRRGATESPKELGEHSQEAVRVLNPQQGYTPASTFMCVCVCVPHSIWQTAD